MDRVRHIVAEVAAAHGVSTAAIYGPSHARQPFRARAEAMWKVYHATKFSYPQVGRIFGGRDHTTVMNACRRYEGKPTLHARRALSQQVAA